MKSFNHFFESATLIITENGGEGASFVELFCAQSKNPSLVAVTQLGKKCWTNVLTKRLHLDFSFEKSLKGRQTATYSHPNTVQLYLP